MCALPAEYAKPHRQPQGKKRGQLEKTGPLVKQGGNEGEEGKPALTCRLSQISAGRIY